jgi:hypothetical protein
MVLTYYYAMVEAPPAQERTRLLRTPWQDWADFILWDLSRPHPEIRNLITRVDLFCWGHAMVQPRVGFIWGNARRQAALPQGNIHFAHSDFLPRYKANKRYSLLGISVGGGQEIWT